MLSFSLHCLRGRLVYVCDTMPLKQFSTYVPFSSPFTSSSSDDARSEEFSTRRVISSLEVLCQMSTNIECIHLIIVSLQRHLPEIISLNESQNTIWRLHSGLSRLFNRSLQVRPVCVCVCVSLSLSAHCINHQERLPSPPFIDFFHLWSTFGAI